MMHCFRKINKTIWYGSNEIKILEWIKNLHKKDKILLIIFNILFIIQ